MQLCSLDSLSQFFVSGPLSLPQTNAIAVVAAARSLQALGFPEQSLRALRRGLQQFPGERILWRELFSYFIAEGLYFSAQAIRIQLERMGAGDVCEGDESEVLRPFSHQPSVSLYIPCCNAEKTIGAAVSAALMQSYGPSQVVVVDDASTDATSQIVAAFPRVQLLRHESSSGIAAARQSVLHVLRGDITAWMDASVVASTFWLERLLVAMIRYPIVGAFGPTLDRHCETLPNIWRHKTSVLQAQGDSDLEDAVPFGGNAIVMTEALRCARMRELSYTDSLQEQELGRRLQAAGFHLRYVHKAQCEQLRCDTMQSALSHRFLAGLPIMKSAGAYDCRESLIVRWQTLLRDSLREMERWSVEGAKDLLFPTFLSIFWTTVCDLSELLAQEDTPAQRQWCADVLAELRAVIQDRVESCPDVFDAVMLHLQSVLEALPEPVLSTGWYRDAATPLASMCLSKFRLMLDFPEHVLEGVAIGARVLLSERELRLNEAHRVAAIDISFLNQWRGGKAFSSRLDIEGDLLAELSRYRVDVAKYDGSSLLATEAQLAAAVRGYEPSELLLSAVGATDDEVLLSICLLREWWETLPLITICSATATLALDASDVVVTRGSLSDVLRALVLPQ